MRKLTAANTAILERAATGVPTPCMRGYRAQVWYYWKWRTITTIMRSSPLLTKQLQSDHSLPCSLPCLFRRTGKYFNSGKNRFSLLNGVKPVLNPTGRIYSIRLCFLRSIKWFTVEVTTDFRHWKRAVRLRALVPSVAILRWMACTTIVKLVALSTIFNILITVLKYPILNKLYCNFIAILLQYLLTMIHETG